MQQNDGTQGVQCRVGKAGDQSSRVRVCQSPGRQEVQRRLEGLAGTANMTAGGTNGVQVAGSVPQMRVDMAGTGGAGGHRRSSGPVTGQRVTAPPVLQTGECAGDGWTARRSQSAADAEQKIESQSQAPELTKHETSEQA